MRTSSLQGGGGIKGVGLIALAEEVSPPLTLPHQPIHPCTSSMQPHTSRPPFTPSLRNPPFGHLPGPPVVTILWQRRCHQRHAVGPRQIRLPPVPWQQAAPVGVDGQQHLQPDGQGPQAWGLRGGTQEKERSGACVPQQLNWKHKRPLAVQAPPGLNLACSLAATSVWATAAEISQRRQASRIRSPSSRAQRTLSCRGPELIGVCTNPLKDVQRISCSWPMQASTAGIPSTHKSALP